MQARLVTYKDGGPDLTFFLDPAGTRIGRDAGNIVQLVSPEISKSHARVRRVEKGWCIQDLNSRNGVFVNGKQVRETFLKHGDTVAIGPFTLVFETDAPGSHCRPVHIIDMTSKADNRTIAAPKRP